jgi:hypothetical protein
LSNGPWQSRHLRSAGFASAGFASGAEEAAGDADDAGCDSAPCVIVLQATAAASTKANRVARDRDCMMDGSVIWRCFGASLDNRIIVTMSLIKKDPMCKGQSSQRRTSSDGRYY